MSDYKFNLTEEQIYKIYRALYDIIGEQYGVHIEFTLEKKEEQNGGNKKRNREK